MVIGVPSGLFYFKYKAFFETFFSELPVETIFSDATSQKTLNAGIAGCVDEACLPIKLFHGHVKELREKCDYIVVPRFMACEYGEAICPKFSGLPELVTSAYQNISLAFTNPLYLNNERKLRKSLMEGASEIGIHKREFQKAYLAAKAAEKKRDSQLIETNYSMRVYLAGHPYHIFDPYVNKDIIKKLHAYGIGVVTEQKKQTRHIGSYHEQLVKSPYWLFFINNYDNVLHYLDQGQIDGVIYLSSFSCGTDSFTIDMIKHRIGDVPLLVMKLDEQTGEAGVDTRIEAFAELLRRRRENDNHISAHG